MNTRKAARRKLASLPDAVFEQAERAVKRLELSRSELCSRALAEYHALERFPGNVRLPSSATDCQKTRARHAVSGRKHWLVDWPRRREEKRASREISMLRSRTMNMRSGWCGNFKGVEWCGRDC